MKWMRMMKKKNVFVKFHIINVYKINISLIAIYKHFFLNDVYKNNFNTLNKLFSHFLIKFSNKFSQIFTNFHTSFIIRIFFSFIIIIIIIVIIFFLFFFVRFL